MTSSAKPALEERQTSANASKSLIWKGTGSWPANAFAAHPLIFVYSFILVLALIAAAECHSIITQLTPRYPIFPSVLYGLVLWCWWGLVTTAIWKFAQKSGKTFFSLSSGFKHACIGAVVAGMHILILQAVLEWSRRQWPVPGSVGFSYLNLNRFFFELLLYGFIFGLTGVIHLQVASQCDKIRALSLERQLSAAHLRALQMQIEPHFLFNTLNAITSLVEQNRREQALGTLQNLNSMLRSTLRRNAPEKVSVAQELELIDDYLSIELTRFADRLRLDMNIDPGALDAQLPCFLLQPIVENAIRHGVSHCQEGGFIEMEVGRRQARLYLTVRNSTPAADTLIEPGHGIGLTNTRERLALFYGDNYELRTGTRQGGDFEVFIGIPYEPGGQ